MKRGAKKKPVALRETLRPLDALPVLSETFQALVQNERARQDSKWGEPAPLGRKAVTRDGDFARLHKLNSVLVEEVGEFAQALLDFERECNDRHPISCACFACEANRHAMLDEIVQAAAVLQKLWEVINK